MSEVLHADGRIVPDDVYVLRVASGVAAESVEVPAGPVLVPLAVWRAQAERLGGRPEVGVWLAPDDDPAVLGPWVGQLARIGVDFPKFTDGRGFSTATLLRTRLGFRGELRALGDVLVDQIFYLRRTGFDVFALRDGQDPVVAVRQLRVFTLAYQAAADAMEPAFRRRPQEEWPQPALRADGSGALA
jgi:uncharacterized protein (DUF934 family)